MAAGGRTFACKIQGTCCWEGYQWHTMGVARYRQTSATCKCILIVLCMCHAISLPSLPSLLHLCRPCKAPATAPSSTADASSPVQAPEGCRLELLGTFPLAGVVESMDVLRSAVPGLQRDTLLLTFRYEQLGVWGCRVLVPSWVRCSRFHLSHLANMTMGMLAHHPTLPHLCG